MASAALRRVGCLHVRRGPQLVRPFSTANSARVDHHFSSEATSSGSAEPISPCGKKKTAALNFDSPQSAHGSTDCGVRLLIDAEQHKFQPAIDSLVLDLQQEYNAFERAVAPTIFHTYQCYKKETMGKIKVDLERSQRFGYHFAGKLVRGAYMMHERERAQEMGYPDPIHETIEDTHNTYDEAVEYLLKKYAENNGKIEVMIASHNQQSIEKAIQLTEKYNIDGPVLSFAQLLGMSDNLTNTLGTNGYRAYKYTPYGEVHEVIPYLLRRAQENSGMLKNGGSSELVLLLQELKRRLTPSNLQRSSE